MDKEEKYNLPIVETGIDNSYAFSSCCILCMHTHLHSVSCTQVFTNYSY